MLFSLAKPAAAKSGPFAGNIECVSEGEAERVSALQAGSLRHSSAAGRTYVNGIGAKAGFGKPVETGLCDVTGGLEPAVKRPA